jgi:hypothetical protein
MDLVSLGNVWADPTNITAKSLGTLKSTLNLISKDPGTSLKLRGGRKLTSTQHPASQWVTEHQNLCKLLSSFTKSLQVIHSKRTEGTLGPLWSRRREYLVQAYQHGCATLLRLEQEMECHASKEWETVKTSLAVEKRMANFCTVVVDSVDTDIALALINTLRQRLECPTKSQENPLLLRIPKTRPVSSDFVQLAFTCLQNYLRCWSTCTNTDQVNEIFHSIICAGCRGSSDTECISTLEDWLAIMSTQNKAIAEAQYISSAKLLLRISSMVGSSKLLDLCMQWLTNGKSSVTEKCTLLCRFRVPDQAAQIHTIASLLEAQLQSSTAVSSFTKVILGWCFSSPLENRHCEWESIQAALLSSLLKLQSSCSRSESITIDVLNARFYLQTPTSVIEQRTKALESLLANLREFCDPSTTLPPMEVGFVTTLFLRATSAFVYSANQATDCGSKVNDIDNPFDESYKYFRALIHDTISLLVSIAFPFQKQSQPLAKGIFEWLLYLSQLIFDESTQFETALEYAEKADEVCGSVDPCARIKLMFRLSQVLYNFSQRLKSNSSTATALITAQRSAALLKNCVQEGSSCPDHEKWKLMLAKRYELVSDLQVSAVTVCGDSNALQSALRLVVSSKDRGEIASFVRRHVRRQTSSGVESDISYDCVSKLVPDHWVYFNEWKALYALRHPARLDLLERWISNAPCSLRRAHAIICKVAESKGESHLDMLLEGIDLLKVRIPE